MEEDFRALATQKARSGVLHAIWCIQDYLKALDVDHTSAFSFRVKSSVMQVTVVGHSTIIDTCTSTADDYMTPLAWKLFHKCLWLLLRDLCEVNVCRYYGLLWRALYLELRIERFMATREGGAAFERPPRFEVAFPAHACTCSSQFKIYRAISYITGPMQALSELVERLQSFEQNDSDNDDDHATSEESRDGLIADLMQYAETEICAYVAQCNEREAHLLGHLHAVAVQMCGSHSA